MILFVIDATAPVGRGDKFVASRLPKSSLCVVNKVDAASKDDVLQQLVTASALAIVGSAALVALWPRNSNAMADAFVPRASNAFAAAATLVVCLLQLGRVTPFLYFNF